jgi:hypothetical protein
MHLGVHHTLCMYTTRQAPYCSLPSRHFNLMVLIFATQLCWRPLPPTGAIATALPNPSAKTSSRGLGQRCLRLIWADSCGGVSNSIVLSLVCIFPFYFSAVPPLHPFCPTCVDCRWAPLPSHFPTPPSPLWWRHRSNPLTLPKPVWCRAIVPLPSPCWHHLCICTATTATAIHLSPCHCFDVHPSHLMRSLLPSLPSAIIVSPQLWRCRCRSQRQGHHRMFFYRLRCPMLPLQ